MEKLLESVRSVILRNRSFLISAHIDPDGDAVGSGVALYRLLRYMGKDVVLYSRDDYPYNFKFLLREDESVQRTLGGIESPDVIFVLDAGHPKRTGEEFFAYLSSFGGEKIAFDHHRNALKAYEGFDTVLVDEQASATAVLIYRLALLWKDKSLIKELAYPIYAAIMSDTGGLRYSSTNEEAFSILGSLVKWVDPWYVSSNIWENKPLGEIRYLAKVLSELKLLLDGRVGMIVVRDADFYEYGITAANIDSFVNYVRAIETVEVAVRLRELEPGVYKVSMRSKSIDISAVAGAFGGGGHKHAAGFLIRGTLKDVESEIERVLEGVL